MRSIISAAFTACILLLLGHTSSQAEMTVKEYTMKMGNPKTKAVMEMYAIGVGRGLHLYNVAVKVVPVRPMQQGLFCLPENTIFTNKIILDATQRVMDTAKGEDPFETLLLLALIDMFPCN